ncbi:gluconokinase [Palleronia sp. THAF1]|uniref:gluconokinase n=1 Tax=Palleronia sp. THAF1 TaxID=2587842 RepID=UPI0020C79199|nr:gluconokinase [Palleronia sp. THAF1]
MSDRVTGPIVVMGVSGCGKTTIGEMLAERTGLTYIDGDALHPQDNIDKMAEGVPLVDSDRWPWLERVGQELDADTIIGCSALKRIYRELIRRKAGDVVFVYLRGARETLIDRMEHRDRHFMPVDLLDSQLATLEEPGADERAVTVDIELSPDQIIDRVVAALT